MTRMTWTCPCSYVVERRLLRKPSVYESDGDFIMRIIDHLCIHVEEIEVLKSLKSLISVANENIEKLNAALGEHEAVIRQQMQEFREAMEELE